MKKHSFLIIALMLLTSTLAAQNNKASVSLTAAIYEEEVSGNLDKAVELYLNILKKYPNDRQVAAKTLYHLGLVNEKMGKQKANEYFTRLVNTYPDQIEVVALAKERLAVLKQPVDASAHQLKSSNRQIWAGSDVDTEGAPSPDGRYLSYTDKSNSLAIYDLKTGERTVLEKQDANRNGMLIDESVWSPDGKQLAYGLNDEGNGVGAIDLVNVDGTGHRTLCAIDTGKFYVWVEDWSQDGKMILAVFEYWDNRGPKIALVSVGDGSVQFIKTASNWDWSLSHKLFFSPDGRFIAYSSPIEKKGKTCDVFVTALDGSSEINITQHPADDRVLGWEPNGSRLLFASDRGGNYNLWATQIVNGQPQGYPKMIKNNIGKISPMGLTNDGSLYYSLTSAEVTGFFSRESNIYLASIDPQTGKILSPPVPATMQNNGFNHSLSWSPDGKKLLYLSSFYWKSNDNWRKSFIFSPETGSEKEVVAQVRSDSVSTNHWFPDGKHLAGAARLPDGSKGICKLEIQTGRIMPLLTSKDKDTSYSFPSVSPDGKILFTLAYIGDNQSIYSYDIERKERRLLFQSGKDRYIYSVRLSPDGGQLAFILMTIRPEEFPALMVMSSSGGEPRAIFRNTTTGPYGLFSWYFGLDWSPDGKYIYFAKRPEAEAPFDLLRIQAQGGTAEPTGLVMEGLHSISIRPDGKQIAFSAGADPKKAIWVLQNIFAEEAGKDKK